MTDATLDAERALVGAVLAGHPNPDALVVTVTPKDFDNPWLEIIWRAITAAVIEGKKIEPMLIKDRLGSDAVKLPGGPVFLIDLAADVRITANAEYYAGIVYSAAVRRRIKTTCHRISLMVDSAELADDDVATLIESARGEMDAALTARLSADLQTFADYLPEVYDVAQNGRTGGLSTPWRSLDRVLNGLLPGQLIVVGARPGVGKSIMGVNLAHWTASQLKRSVFFASLEMPGAEVSQRLVAHQAGVNFTALATGQMSEASWHKTNEAHSTMASLPIFIEDSAIQNIASIRTAVMSIRKKRDDLGLIVIDYVQLVTPRDKRLNRAEQIGEVTRELKILAKEMGVPVVVMAQVNRGPMNRPNGKPTLSDLRESGSIEADADTVLLLHREALEDGGMSTVVDVGIAKNRSGPQASIQLEVWGHYSRMTEVYNHHEKESVA